MISFLLYLGIFVASSLPASALPGKVPDIIPHFCAYAILAFFFVQVFDDPLNLKKMASAWVALIVLGFFDEVHQSFVPSRFCSLKDMTVDALGSAFGLLAYRWKEQIKNGI
ncbi:MAG: VanZ family protein [Candidatus Aminicenantes bacterium]|nr:VanZ family protein [Candidatus Aminicenantes bacterium]